MLMTSRTHTLLTGLGRYVRCLSLVLLPALVAEGGQAQRGPSVQLLPDSHRPEPYESVPAPYLTVVGPPPMRFREPPAPPSFELEPMVAGPALLDESVPAPASASASASATPRRERLGLSQPTTVSPQPPLSSPTARRPDEGDPSPILPDDMRRDVRPEDLLPFFQYPRNGGSVIGVGVPVPFQPPAPTQPPSSATYRLQ
jgi:hypothetical protein